MLRLFFLFLSPALVASGVLEWFELLQFGEKQVFSKRWTGVGHANYHMVSTLAFMPICDWSSPKGTARTNVHCGSVCRLIKESFDGKYPFAKAGYSSQDHVNFVALAPDEANKVIKVTDAGAANNAEQKANIFLSFRGTYAWDIINNRRNREFRFESVTFCPACGVHTGFWRNFLALKFSITKVVNLVATTGNHKIATADRKLAIFGHSMGAAMANLASVWFFSVTQVKTSCLYTMGQPRMYNGHMRAVMEDSFAHASMFTNARDVVSHMPPRLMGYRHALPIVEMYTDPSYFVGMETGDVDGDYARYKSYREFSGTKFDAKFAGMFRFGGVEDHMNYWVELDSNDMMSCGGFADHYLQNSAAIHLFGV